MELHMTVPRTVRIVLETLLVEALCIALGWLLFQFFSLFTGGSWPLLPLLAISIVPALVYLAIRLNKMPLASPFALDLVTGFLRGIIVSGGLVFTVWVGDYSNPDPPGTCEPCFSTTALVGWMAIIVILPAFIILTPLYGLIIRRKEKSSG